MSEQERHVALLNAIDQAVIASDLAGHILYWNEAAETLYGWPAEEVRGRDIVEVTPAEISREDAASIMKTIGAGEIWSGVFPVRDREGNQFSAAVTDVPVIEHGRVVGVIGVSKRDERATPLPLLAAEFTNAIDRLWPGQLRLAVGGGFEDAIAGVGDPHILQLFALLLVRGFDALERGERFELSLSRPSKDILNQFRVVLPAARCAYIRIAGEARTSLREAMRTAEESRYAAKLVALAGGRLFIGTNGAGAPAMHLFLPVGI